MQQQATVIWNSARGVWEKVGMANLLCEHWALFSETWPTSGMMRNGQVFELPMPTHHTTDSGSSSSPILLATPKAQEGAGGALGEETARARGNHVGVRDQAMDLAKLNGEKVSRVQENLLGTPRTSSANASTTKQVEAGAPKSRLEDQVHLNWGKFEPAIRRWEEALGRPAPLPTKPDGKDGAHRLSSAFTEWMMGVPEGWITGVGLTRNEELKACGNGVVPQQAELALRVLLEGIALPRGGGQVNLPTPTVSDTFTDNLASTQQKEGSLHSVTLPQAVRMLSGKVREGQELTTLDPQTDNRTIGDSKSTAGEGE